MNDDAQVIEAALRRRFERSATPPCPDGAWRAARTSRSTTVRRNSLGRGLAYAAALVGAISIGGLAAQASGSVNFRDIAGLRFFPSSRPLPPLIHRADRLTVAEAQRHMPFPIVMPTGLPAGTRLRYAHVLREAPNAGVALAYEAKIANTYSMININEWLGDAEPFTPARVRSGYKPALHFTVRRAGHATQTFDVGERRWKHGNVTMLLFAPGLPRAMSDRIVRENSQ